MPRSEPSRSRIVVKERTYHVISHGPPRVCSKSARLHHLRSNLSHRNFSRLAVSPLFAIRSLNVGKELQLLLGVITLNRPPFHVQPQPYYLSELFLSRCETDLHLPPTKTSPSQGTSRSMCLHEHEKILIVLVSANHSFYGRLGQARVSSTLGSPAACSDKVGRHRCANALAPGMWSQCGRADHIRNFEFTVARQRASGTREACFRS